MDLEEALRYSGQDNMENAFKFFSNIGVSSFIITNGA